MKRAVLLLIVLSFCASLTYASPKNISKECHLFRERWRYHLKSKGLTQAQLAAAHDTHHDACRECQHYTQKQKTIKKSDTISPAMYNLSTIARKKTVGCARCRHRISCALWKRDISKALDLATTTMPDQHIQQCQSCRIVAYYIITRHWHMHIEGSSFEKCYDTLTQMVPAEAQACALQMRMATSKTELYASYSRKTPQCGQQRQHIAVLLRRNALKTALNAVTKSMHIHTCSACQSAILRTIINKQALAQENPQLIALYELVKQKQSNRPLEDAAAGQAHALEEPSTPPAKRVAYAMDSRAAEPPYELLGSAAVVLQEPLAPESPPAWSMTLGELPSQFPG